MAPSRGKGKGKGKAIMRSSTTPRRATRVKPKANEGVPDVYQDLLAEAAATDTAEYESDRPLKKRKVASSTSASAQQPPGNVGGDLNVLTGQSTENSSESGEDDDDESDLAFEDVDLDQPSTLLEEDDEIEDVSISVDATTMPKRRAQANRRPASASEKAFRILVHKAHVLCLLGHCIYINSWCNNVVVQRHLRSILSKKTRSYLSYNIDDTQFQQNRSFMDGLQQASDAFRGMFEITASGMRKAKWPADEDNGSEQRDGEPVDRSDFIGAARDMQGSQDTGNQLFCALLRAAGVEARLVCSLQPLPFASTGAKSGTPQKLTKPTVFAFAPATDSNPSDSNKEDASMENSSSVGKVPSVRRRLGHPSLAIEPSTATASKKKKPIRKLAYPVFWVEAFNAAQQKWIAVDPIVTQSVGKATRLEPPSSYDLNSISYVIAFESEGVARDVTRRYARAYNAKTRRRRVESTDNGTHWLRKALRIFRRRGGALDREQVEDAELAQKEAKEGLPNNVQDFKDHPYYALARHLKRNEVLHPKREVGKVNAGTPAKPRMEAVYRRQDVCVCRSADKWFRLGREIQRGEQPIKRVPARRSGRTRDLEAEDEDEDGEEATMTPLYAQYQTELYVPPPVVKGRVPRNEYGNLDIYVPSMVPAGGAHIRHSLAQQAARILRVDYAEAVTGFQFKGRHGTAIKEGVVVASQHADAVQAVVEGLEDDQMEDASKARSAIALKMWRRMLTGLRIAERVSGYGNTTSKEDMKMQLDEREKEQEEVAEAGGFLLMDAAEEIALPTAGRFSLDELSAPVKKPSRNRMKKELEEESERKADFLYKQQDEDAYAPARSLRSARRKVIDDEDEDEDEDMSDAKTSFVDAEDNAIESTDDTVMQDDKGGGFLSEDTANDLAEGASFLPGDDQMPLEEPEGGGGFLIEDDALEEAAGHGQGEILLQPSVENGVTIEDVVGSASPHMTAPDTSNAGEMLAHSDHDVLVHDRLEEDMALQAPSGNEGLVQNGAYGAKPFEKADDVHDEGSDVGSMISHDPEDEDAEPDWLESDSD